MAASLSLERIVDAGVVVVRGQGWPALSLRAVAAELGVTPMALYRHVTDGDELRALVLDAVVAQLARVEASGDLVADLTSWTRRFHADLADYPGVAAHLLTAWFACGGMLERIDELLGLVHAHDIDGFDAVAATNALFMYALLRSEAERSIRDAGVVRRTLRTASATRELHHLTALAGHYTTAELDAHFEFGLQALVAGLRLDERQPA